MMSKICSTPTTREVPTDDDWTKATSPSSSMSHPAEDDDIESTVYLNVDTLENLEAFESNGNVFLDAMDSLHSGAALSADMHMMDGGYHYAPLSLASRVVERAKLGVDETVPSALPEVCKGRRVLVDYLSRLYGIYSYEPSNGDGRRVGIWSASSKDRGFSGAAHTESSNSSSNAGTILGGTEAAASLSELAYRFQQSRLSYGGIDAASPSATCNLLPSQVCLQTCADLWEFCRVYGGTTTDGNGGSKSSNVASGNNQPLPLPTLQQRLGSFEEAVMVYFQGIEDKTKVTATEDGSKGGSKLPQAIISPPSSPMRDMEKLLGPADWSWIRPFMSAGYRTATAAAAAAARAVDASVDAFQVGPSVASSHPPTNKSPLQSTFPSTMPTCETLRDVFLTSLVYKKPKNGFEWLCRRMIGLPLGLQSGGGSPAFSDGIAPTLSPLGKQEEAGRQNANTILLSFPSFSQVALQIIFLIGDVATLHDPELLTVTMTTTSSAKGGSSSSSSTVSSSSSASSSSSSRTASKSATALPHSQRSRFWSWRTRAGVLSSGPPACLHTGHCRNCQLWLLSLEEEEQIGGPKNDRATNARAPQQLKSASPSTKKRAAAAAAAASVAAASLVEQRKSGGGNSRDGSASTRASTPKRSSDIPDDSPSGGSASVSGKSSGLLPVLTAKVLSIWQALSLVATLLDAEGRFSRGSVGYYENLPVSSSVPSAVASGVAASIESASPLPSHSPPSRYVWSLAGRRDLIEMLLTLALGRFDAAPILLGDDNKDMLFADIHVSALETSRSPLLQGTSSLPLYGATFSAIVLPYLDALEKSFQSHTRGGGGGAGGVKTALPHAAKERDAPLISVQDFLVGIMCTWLREQKRASLLPQPAWLREQNRASLLPQPALQQYSPSPAVVAFGADTRLDAAVSSLLPLGAANISVRDTDSIASSGTRGALPVQPAGTPQQLPRNVESERGGKGLFSVPTMSSPAGSVGIGGPSSSSSNRLKELPVSSSNYISSSITRSSLATQSPESAVADAVVPSAEAVIPSPPPTPARTPADISESTPNDSPVSIGKVSIGCGGGGGASSSTSKGATTCTLQ